MSANRRIHAARAGESHLERVDVHRIHERVAVKSRHVWGKFVLCEINKTTAPRPPWLPGLLLVQRHSASAHASAERWPASPEAVPAQAHRSHFQSISFIELEIRFYLLSPIPDFTEEEKGHCTAGRKCAVFFSLHIFFF